jgi:hypothetical protein
MTDSASTDAVSSGDAGPGGAEQLDCREDDRVLATRDLLVDDGLDGTRREGRRHDVLRQPLGTDLHVGDDAVPRLVQPEVRDRAERRVGVVARREPLIDMAETETRREDAGGALSCNDGAEILPRERPRAGAEAVLDPRLQDRYVAQSRHRRGSLRVWILPYEGHHACRGCQPSG